MREFAPCIAPNKSNPFEMKYKKINENRCLVLVFCFCPKEVCYIEIDSNNLLLQCIETIKLIDRILA